MHLLSCHHQPSRGRTLLDVCPRLLSTAKESLVNGDQAWRLPAGGGGAAVAAAAAAAEAEAEAAAPPARCRPRRRARRARPHPYGGPARPAGAPSAAPAPFPADPQRVLGAAPLSQSIDALSTVEAPHPRRPPDGRQVRAARALMGFPSDCGGGTKTRRPIHLQMQFHGPRAARLLPPHRQRGAPRRRQRAPAERVSLGELRAYIESENQRLERLDLLGGGDHRAHRVPLLAQPLHHRHPRLLAVGPGAPRRAGRRTAATAAAAATSAATAAARRARRRAAQQRAAWRRSC